MNEDYINDMISRPEKGETQSITIKPKQMKRQDEFKTVSQNPSKYFLEWKSDKGNFEYYDKETEQKIDVNLPFKFLTLKEMHTVKGWSDSSESAIWSNEVKYIGTEELKVRSFKGGEIATGLYKDIKNRVKDFGGHYVKSIYIMTEDGEIWNLQLKGSAVQQWGDFTQKTKSRLGDEWVEVTGADQRKKGSIKYSVPIFTFNTSLSEDEGEQADLAYATLETYIKDYLEDKAISNKVDEELDLVQDIVDENKIDNDLPF